jgi:hypothetical protein
MPFSHVINEYHPEQLAQLTEAFNLAWPLILIASGPFTEAQLDGLRHRLANYIVACTSNGEFDPEKLKETALRAFNDSGLATGGWLLEPMFGRSENG